MNEDITLPAWLALVLLFVASASSFLFAKATESWSWRNAAIKNKVVMFHPTTGKSVWATTSEETP